jgi:hypothetical protein
MTDTPPEPVAQLAAFIAPASRPPAAESNAQLIVALAVAGGLALIALALIAAMVATKNWAALSLVGVIVGSLGTALNAPTGIAAALRSMKAPPS